MWDESTHSIFFHRTPGRQSVSVGIWIAHGAAHDPENFAGATHLVEHLTLRRCGGRERLDLARQLDRLGGDIDAWTSAESMGLSVQTTLDALPEALEILQDAILRPSFAPEDVSMEKQIVLAEQSLAEDDPSDRVGEAILKAAWGAHPLARPIVGSRKSISSLHPELLENHHRTQLLQPDKIVIGVVGDPRPGLVEEGLREIPLGKELKRSCLSTPSWMADSITINGSSVDQTHTRLAFPAVELQHPDALNFAVLSRILGGGNSSRLFQKLREDQGLCYDIWTASVLRSSAGLLEIGWASSSKHADRCWELVLAEVENLGESLSHIEVETAVQGMKRSLLMDAETPQGRAALDIGEILDRGRRFSLKRVLEELDAITREDLSRVAAQYLRPELMASAVCRA